MLKFEITGVPNWTTRRIQRVVGQLIENFIVGLFMTSREDLNNLQENAKLDTLTTVHVTLCEKSFLVENNDTLNVII